MISRLYVICQNLHLGNVSFDRLRQEVILSNFCLGRHLLNDELLTDQRGSPAYISPEVLSGHPYKGKPSDMWALGVMLYTMLYGRFPFYDSDPRKLFRKIKTADFEFPVDDVKDDGGGGLLSQQNPQQPRVRRGRVEDGCLRLIRGILRLDPSSRLTADEALDAVESIFATWRRLSASPSTQVVPEFVDEAVEEEEESLANQVVPPTTVISSSETVEDPAATKMQLGNFLSTASSIPPPPRDHPDHSDHPNSSFYPVSPTSSGECLRERYNHPHPNPRSLAAPYRVDRYHHNHQQQQQAPYPFPHQEAVASIYPSFPPFSSSSISYGGGGVGVGASYLPVVIVGGEEETAILDLRTSFLVNN